MLDLAIMRCAVVREVDTIEAFIKQKGQLHCAVVQGLDLSEVDIDWTKLNFNGAVFLGCHFPKSVTAEFLIENGAVIFPKIPNVPYNAYRHSLYSREELMEGWTEKEDRSVDRKIYDHFIKKGGSNPDILESLAQRLHDHSIDDGVRDLLNGRVEGGEPKKVVGIMGGHSTPRDNYFYKQVVRLAWRLTREGYFIATGGGPGVMEAGNLGAWLYAASEDDLERVIDSLSMAPHFESPNYLSLAREVLKEFPEGGSSIAVPTWFYGHEPTNLFSKYIAKYFSNSIREDGLLSIAEYGVVFSPGSAGTTQEIFMDATQNHYVTFGSISPMVFLGEKRYNQETMLYPCIKDLAKDEKYARMLYCSDEVESIVDFIKANPPERVKKG